MSTTTISNEYISSSGNNFYPALQEGVHYIPIRTNGVSVFQILGKPYKHAETTTDHHLCKYIHVLSDAGDHITHVLTAKAATLMDIIYKKVTAGKWINKIKEYYLSSTHPEILSLVLNNNSESPIDRGWKIQERVIFNIYDPLTEKIGILLQRSNNEGTRGLAGISMGAFKAFAKLWHDYGLEYQEENIAYINWGNNPPYHEFMCKSHKDTATIKASGLSHLLGKTSNRTTKDTILYNTSTVHAAEPTALLYEHIQGHIKTIDTQLSTEYTKAFKECILSEKETESEGIPF